MRRSALRLGETQAQCFLLLGPTQRQLDAARETLGREVAVPRQKMVPSGSSKERGGGVLRFGDTQAENFLLVGPTHRQPDAAGQALGGKVRRLASGADGFNHRRSEKRKWDQASDVAVGHLVALGNLEGVLHAPRGQLVKPASSACNRPDEDGVNVRGRSGYSREEDPLLNTAASKLHGYASLDGQACLAFNFKLCLEQR